MEEQNIPVYIPGASDKEPDPLQAGQTQIPDTTPRLVVADEIIWIDNPECSGEDKASQEECGENTVHVDKCLNNNKSADELGNTLN